jgi:NAD(P)-dependent dehydrogenase (short-subunit alcohol dehydrogenase family)
MKDYAEKTAVVTGGASGIGLALGRELAARGARVVLADVEQSALDTAVAGLLETGGKAHGVVTDVSDYESVVALERRAVELGDGKVHLLFNNAGVGVYEDLPLWELPLVDWKWTLDVNLWGVIHGLRAFVPGMLAHGEPGHVVNTSSGNGGLTLLSTTPIYSTSKAAVSTLTEALHLQLVAAGAAIRASVLYPGPHMVSSNIFTAFRNRPSGLLRDDGQQTPPTLDEIREMVAGMGQELELTSPEQVAGMAMTALDDDEYWILDMSDDTEAAVRARFENILHRHTP